MSEFIILFLVINAEFETFVVGNAKASILEYEENQLISPVEGGGKLKPLSCALWITMCIGACLITSATDARLMFARKKWFWDTNTRVFEDDLYTHLTYGCARMHRSLERWSPCVANSLTVGRGWVLSRNVRCRMNESCLESFFVHAWEVIIIKQLKDQTKREHISEYRMPRTYPQTTVYFRNLGRIVPVWDETENNRA